MNDTFNQNENNFAGNTAVAPAPTAIADAFGTEIQKGDLIVFAVRKGSRQWLNKLRVTGVTASSVKGYDPEDTMQRSKTLRQMRTVVVLESASV